MPQGAVRSSDGVRTAASTLVTASVPAGDASPGEPAASRTPVSTQAARRPTNVRTTRSHEGGRRARAIVNSDVQRSNVLPRAVEYAFIRADMRRLLLTAGCLAAVMILLLLLLGG